MYCAAAGMDAGSARMRTMVVITATSGGGKGRHVQHPQAGDAALRVHVEQQVARDSDGPHAPAAAKPEVDGGLAVIGFGGERCVHPQWRNTRPRNARWK